MTVSQSVRKAFFLGLLGFIYTQISAQVNLTPDRFAFEPELTYNPAIPSPAKVLGYELGERFTEYAATVEYMKKVAEASDRITIGNYGETYEGRPLIYLVITSHALAEKISSTVC
ncbi:MAG: hypothetical protein AB8G86_04575 [Saprospiraceae bacterium]